SAMSPASGAFTGRLQTGSVLPGRGGGDHRAAGGRGDNRTGVLPARKLGQRSGQLRQVGSADDPEVGLLGVVHLDQRLDLGHQVDQLGDLVKYLVRVEG